MAKTLSDEAKIRKHKYDIAYDAENTTQLKTKLNNRTDADILQFLNTVPNKQGLVKELLRRHMNEIGFVYEPSAQEE